MKLQQVLSSLNQIEKSKFINNLDKLCAIAESGNEDVTKTLEKINRQIKEASGREVTQLFQAIANEYQQSVKEQLSLSGASVALLVNILTRDGNCVARISWIEQLYSRECELLEKTSQQIIADIKDSSTEGFDRPHRLKIFKDCLEVAYNNDLRINRQANISDDERSVLNKLAYHLKISHDEASAIEHLSNPVKAGKETVDECLQYLREIGVIFINKKSSEVLVPDEVVRILNDAQGKELADKHVLRILRTLSDAELSNILKNYGQKIRGVDRSEKIRTIMHCSTSIRDVLTTDLFDKDINVSKRKDRLKELMNDLTIDSDRLGVTLDDRVRVIFNSLNQSIETELNAISVTSYKDMYLALEKRFSDIYPNGENLSGRLKKEFELEDNEEISIDRLRALSITPHDILYTLSNDEVKQVRNSLELSNRGNPRLAILEAFSNANDKLIENYEALARRDLANLKSVGIDINESEIGLKFEEATRTIFEGLDLAVDEDLRNRINTAKDKADIIISISDDDVIIGEAKTCKNGDFAKYSTASRQVKAYANRCENQGARVAQVLIVAPSFSEDFIESAEMDTEVNISLLTADGLKKIYDAYKAKKKPNFSPKLFTKGGLLKAELIAKNL
ncbi:hypothetical protein KO507_16945 [Gilvimarinus agarilyticus]|uniref:hypothetical protein n=1 Tax=Gilvimarinus sp. 2_MG-2023 TaxID=3062666 RepID=UPI001C0A22DC|nr:hypothetical protein [Gilvimarinus sp. 2_MG-2023]MBU2887456.1 hypothetical protein [Gilvimarinus agarilyticus]MDO6572115.1 hypothetical protein [Gilvimarinus sp. 2_MG-2023]